MATREHKATTNGGLKFTESGPDNLAEIDPTNLAALGSTPAESDNILVDDGGTPKKSTWANIKAWIKTYLEGLTFRRRWTQLTATTDFATTAPSTSTITMNTDQTGNIEIGDPIKFKLSGSYYWAQCAALTANLMTIRGAPLTTGAGDLEELYYGLAEMVIKESFFVPGNYGAGIEPDALKDIANSQEEWDHARGYLVHLAATHSVVDSGTEADVSMGFGDTDPLSTDLTLGAADAWIETAVASFDTSKHMVDFGDEVEVSIKTAGGTGDAEDLTVRAIFVLEK